MPSSKRRRKQVELRRRQIERARRKLALESENKENRDPPLLRSCRSDSSLEQYRNQLESNLPASGENGKGWWGGLYNWCSSGIIQSVETAKDMIFPSRVLRRQLDDAQQRLREMEEELEMIRNQELRKRKRRKKTKAQQAESRSQLVVTVDDLRNVKLKSAGERRGVKRHRSSISSGFVVSLADLKNVSLRKTIHKGRPFTRRRSFHCTPSQQEDVATDIMQFRRSLRRINIVRSPGGTPHYPEKQPSDEGEGPTPMLTRALRRKFRVACPLSPIPSVSPSPTVSPVSQALPSPPPPSTQTTAPPSPPPNSAETTSPPSPVSIFEIREI